MKATICKEYVLTLNENVTVTHVDRTNTIFRAKKGACDRELIKAASAGIIDQLNDSLGEWQVMVRTESIEWED